MFDIVFVGLILHPRLPYPHDVENPFKPTRCNGIANGMDLPMPPIDEQEIGHFAKALLVFCWGNHLALLAKFPSLFVFVVAWRL